MHIMTMILIEANPEDKAAVPQTVVRQMYDLLGTNMTKILGETSPDWRSDVEFDEWRDNVFLGDVQFHTSHVLLLDKKELRGLLSYTACPDSGEIYLNEVQISPSCQGDGFTLLKLLRMFAERIDLLPHDSLRTYTNKVNERVQNLALKSGLARVGETQRGYQYLMPKRVFMERFK